MYVRSLITLTQLDGTCAGQLPRVHEARLELTANQNSYMHVFLLTGFILFFEVRHTEKGFLRISSEHDQITATGSLLRSHNFPIYLENLLLPLPQQQIDRPEDI